MTHVDMHEAKTNLSKLVERVEGGEEIVITRRGEPAVRLVAERRGESEEGQAVHCEPPSPPSIRCGLN